ncbi:MAG TPA: hypothetical protein ENK43_03225 [Planctomycetes bacterium]|nr:hypothetical protein [Planctomycetota bacterium]
MVLSPEVRSEAAWILLGEKAARRGDPLERILRRATRRVERFRKPRGKNVDRLDKLPMPARTPPARIRDAEDLLLVLETFETWPPEYVRFFLETALFDTSCDQSARLWLHGAWNRHQARRLYASLRQRLVHVLRRNDEG